MFLSLSISAPLPLSLKSVKKENTSSGKNQIFCFIFNWFLFAALVTGTKPDSLPPPHLGQESCFLLVLPQSPDDKMNMKKCFLSSAHLFWEAKRQGLLEPSPLGPPSHTNTSLPTRPVQRGQLERGAPQRRGACVAAVGQHLTDPRHLPGKQDPHLSGGREEAALNKAQLEEITHQQFNAGLIPAGCPTSLKGKEPPQEWVGGYRADAVEGSRCSHSLSVELGPCYWHREL